MEKPELIANADCAYSPKIQKSLDSMASRIGRSVAILREWRALEYTGHFIDVDEEMKIRIQETLVKTQDILTEWGYPNVP